MPRKIVVSRANYSVFGNLVSEEPKEEFPCEPDEFDEAEGTTAVDLAMEVLNLKIYAEEASSYPDWQKSTWYSRSEEIFDNEDTERLEISAHLEGFSDIEALEIYKRFTTR